jgi:thioredoxin reductase (NADPH)
VIGGGDVAVEEAMHLSKFGSKVYLIVRSDKLRASKAMQDKLFANEKIEILRNTQCTKADGSDLLQNIYISNSLT